LIFLIRLYLGSSASINKRWQGTMEGKMIEITLVRSGISRPETQQRTLRGLGLTRMHRTVRLKDTPPIRGMIRKVSHMVKVVEK
jgi:large subunit ribosomal protein L30